MKDYSDQRAEALAWWRSLSPSTIDRLIVKHRPGVIDLAVKRSDLEIHKIYEAEKNASMLYVKLFLDDIRNPSWIGLVDEEWTVVRSYKEFKAHINRYGVPNEVSFDHDLGTDETGYDAAKYLANHCLEFKIPLPKCWSHSANPVGKANIISYWKAAVKEQSK